MNIEINKFNWNILKKTYLSQFKFKSVYTIQKDHFETFSEH